MLRIGLGVLLLLDPWYTNWTPAWRTPAWRTPISVQKKCPQASTFDIVYLVGGAITPLKNMKTRQWVLDDIPYMKWKINNV
jgi:hypothetical protein